MTGEATVRPWEEERPRVVRELRGCPQVHLKWLISKS